MIYYGYDYLFNDFNNKIKTYCFQGKEEYFLNKVWIYDSNQKLIQINEFYKDSILHAKTFFEYLRDARPERIKKLKAARKHTIPAFDSDKNKPLTMIIKAMSKKTTFLFNMMCIISKSTTLGG